MNILILNRRPMLTGATLAVAGVTGPALALAGPRDRPRYDGLKKTIAVTADGRTAKLTQALVEDGRFLVVEGSGGPMEASAIVRAAVICFRSARAWAR